MVTSIPLISNADNISIILQYKTEYIQCIGLPVTNVASVIFVHIIRIFSLHKHLYIYNVYLNVVMTNSIG